MPELFQPVQQITESLGRAGVPLPEAFARSEFNGDDCVREAYRKLFTQSDLDDGAAGGVSLKQSTQSDFDDGAAGEVSLKQSARLDLDDDVFMRQSYFGESAIFVILRPKTKGAHDDGMAALFVQTKQSVVFILIEPFHGTVVHAKH